LKKSKRNFVLSYRTKGLKEANMIRNSMAALIHKTNSKGMGSKPSSLKLSSIEKQWLDEPDKPCRKSVSDIKLGCTSILRR